MSTKRKDNWLEVICQPVLRTLEVVVILLVVMLVGDVLWQVLTRYGTKFGFVPSRWTEEVARLLLIWVTFLGAAVGFARGKHLGLDYFAGLLESQSRRYLQVLGEILVMTFAAVILVWGGIILVGETLRAEQTTPALQIRMGYIYLAAPLSGVCIILFSFRNLLAYLAQSDNPSTDTSSSK